MGLFNKLLRAGEGKKLKVLESIVPEVAGFESATKRLTDQQLRAKTDEFRARLDRGEDLDDLLAEAFAVVREAGTRVLGQRHFDVQIMGGAALHFGWVAEMRTGEGKTLVATLPSYLNALSGQGVHLVTVNDYLAKFHSEWMGRLHRFLGLEVGLVIPDLDDPDEKRRAYACDITYGTNNEFGFDYLRDNMAVTKAGMSQRGHNFAIVDEVDSILIDEARTPLIISGRLEDAAQLYYKFAAIARQLKRDVDYEFDEKKRTIAPTEEGVDRVEQALGVENLYEDVNQNYVHQLQAALKAKELFKRNVDYLIQDGEVKIVDEFTGRILEGRRWSEGLHQAVEAKEGVPIKAENQTLATITLQNYFRMYDKLGGMTGTAATEAGEFAHTYNLEVVTIPTNRAMIRADQPDLIFRSEEAKFSAGVDDIAERYAAGQPVLVGTVSVEKSELLSSMLRQQGIPHEVLNAKEHAREGEIIAQAGRIGAVTVATNMAGRGVDILLGGNPEGLARRELAKQGVFVGAEEDGGITDDEYTNRLEEMTAKFKPECDAMGDEVRKLGGLYVLGTERHESRRIDNQLRGRAGRQGDPGESRFYLSLEDDLMRLFATGAMNWVMTRALPEDEAIEAKSVTKAIERAQRTVEDRNFEIRKNVLKYDEVMNQQRKVIYARRQQILDGAEMRDLSMEWIRGAIDRAVDEHCAAEYPEDWDLDGLLKSVKQSYPTALTLERLQQLERSKQIATELEQEAISQYEAREQQLGAERLRENERRIMLLMIDRYWREHLYEMDYLQEGIHLRGIGQKDPLAEWQREGFDMFESMMGLIQHDFIGYVFNKERVDEQAKALPSNLVYTAPEDPVTGAASMREAAMAEAAAAGGQVSMPPPGAPAAAPSMASGSMSGGGLVQAVAASTRSAPPDATGGAVEEAPKPVRVTKTPGRNELCHCGSGKKYKFCHMQSDAKSG